MQKVGVGFFVLAAGNEKNESIFFLIVSPIFLTVSPIIINIIFRNCWRKKFPFGTLHAFPNSYTLNS